MAQTYLNDNKSMPYPLWGYGAQPFSMACLVGLGVCIRDDEPVNWGPMVVASVAITEDSINLAIGRKNDKNEFVLIGTIYANTSGYSVYVPASFYTTYGDGSSLQRTLEQVLARWAGAHTVTPTVDGEIHYNEDIPTEPLFNVYYIPAELPTVMASDVQVHIDPVGAAVSMSVYYTTTIEPEARAVLSTAASTGYMVIGTIPEESIGFWGDKYPLDPSCVTYLDNKVHGGFNIININGQYKTPGQVLTLEASGLVGFEVTGNTVTMVPSKEADVLILSTTNVDDAELVTSLNGHTIEASPSNPTPTLQLEGQCIESEDTIDDIVAWEWARWSYPNKQTADVGILTLELNGTDKFPNCYEET